MGNIGMGRNKYIDCANFKSKFSDFKMGNSYKLFLSKRTVKIHLKSA